MLVVLFTANGVRAQQESDEAKGDVIVINKADFLEKVYNYEKNTSEWVYEGEKPCIIDFYADWCGPCRRIAPIMKELATEYKTDILIYKIDVDKEKELAAHFGVSSIPMILFVPKEGRPQYLLGAYPKETIVETINSFLLKKQ
jgi:thioredoxin